MSVLQSLAKLGMVKLWRQRHSAVICKLFQYGIGSMALMLTKFASLDPGSTSSPRLATPGTPFAGWMSQIFCPTGDEAVNWARYAWVWQLKIAVGSSLPGHLQP